MSRYYERRLPHWQPEGKALFITWRLWGSLPVGAWAEAEAKPEARAARTLPARGQECPRHKKPSAGERFLAMDRLLDTSSRRVAWLSDARVASAVVAALQRGQDEPHHYHLHAFVVMPNHVQILVDAGIAAVRFLAGLEGAIARAANSILHRTGRPFWQDESFDRWVRNGKEFERTVLFLLPVPPIICEPEIQSWLPRHAGVECERHK